MYNIKFILFRFISFTLTPFFKFITKFNKIKNGINTQLIGLSKIFIEKYILIGDRSVITINNRSNNNGALYIRSGCFGRDNFISIGRRSFIGRHFFSSASCSFLCATHDYSNPLIPYQIAKINFNKRIWIQDNVFIGANCLILGDVKIGFGSFINAGSIINFDIPPLSFVTGKISKIEKRYDFKAKKWINVRDFNEETLPTYGEYKKMLKTKIIPYNPYAYTVKSGWIY
jgi:acetyltransferase-like isoleucine patch superfamily enzyme